MKFNNIFNDYFWGWLIGGLFIVLTIEQDLPFILQTIILVCVYVVGYGMVRISQRILHDK